MSDLIDTANDVIEQQLAKSVQSIQQQFSGESLQYCEYCDDEIPLARRALGGVRLCVACQSEHERRER